MKITYLFIFILSAAFLNVNAQYRNLLHKSHGERTPDMYTLYFGDVANLALDSAKALEVANRIAKMAIEENDEDLLLETKLIILHYYYYRDFSPSFIRAQFEALLKEAHEKKKAWLIGRVEGTWGVYEGDLNQYELAFEHFHRMYSVIKDMSPEDFPQKQNSLILIANAHYKFRDYAAAARYLKEGLQEGPRPWNVLYITGMNTLGLSCRALNQIDSSNYYFRQVLEWCRQTKSTQWEGIVSGNLGYNYFMLKEYDSAEVLLQKDAEVSLAFKDFGVASTALMTLAEISLIRNDRDSAARRLMRAREYAYLSGQYKRLSTLYPLLSKFYLHRGNNKLATLYFDSAIVVRDSLDREFNSLFLARAEQKVELERHRQEMEQLNSQKMIKTLQRNALVIIAVLFMIIALFIYDRQKRRYKEKSLQLESANHELDRSIKQLIAFTRNISEKNQLIGDLQQKITTPDSEVLMQLQHSIILTDEQWAEFKNLFDKVHVGYLQRLKDKIPGLTPAETRFVALSKLGLSNKEMSAMLGNSTDAIRQYRSRLRKKLQLGEMEQLEEVLGNI